MLCIFSKRLHSFFEEETSSMWSFTPQLCKDSQQIPYSRFATFSSNHCSQSIIWSTTVTSSVQYSWHYCVRLGQFRFRLRWRHSLNHFPFVHNKQYFLMHFIMYSFFVTVVFHSTSYEQKIYIIICKVVASWHLLQVWLLILLVKYARQTWSSYWYAYFQWCHIELLSNWTRISSWQKWRTAYIYIHSHHFCTT